MLKVGDKVEWLDLGGNRGYRYMTIGKVYTIVEVDTMDPEPEIVVTDDDGDLVSWYSYRFRKVEDTWNGSTDTTISTVDYKFEHGVGKLVKLCACDLTVVLHRGCQCGGV